MKALTRVQIKRTKRVHPDWSNEQILEHIKIFTDAAGPHPDTVTLEGVRDVICSMDEYRPGRLNAERLQEQADARMEER